MKLSILDQALVPSGSSPGDALRNMIELARLADSLGYHRFWVAEHHASELAACPAPEVLIARLGMETKHMRIGSGGVMLSHYSPLKVAETFRVLHAMYLDRVDLGVGRSPGAGELETFALRRERSDGPAPDDFPDQLTELLAFLRHDFSSAHPFSRIKVAPEMPGMPDVWFLGSSPRSAAAAAQHGLPFVLGHFQSSRHTRAAVETYRTNFKPSRWQSKPRAIIAVSAICAETDADAVRLSSSVRVVQPGTARIPSVEAAQRQLAISAATFDSKQEAGEWPQHFFGSANTLRERLGEMASALEIEELMILTIMHDHRARIRSYELLAQAFGLHAQA